MNEIQRLMFNSLQRTRSNILDWIDQAKNNNSPFWVVDELKEMLNQIEKTIKAAEDIGKLRINQ